MWRKKKNEKNMTFLCTIATRSQTAAQTFLSLFDSANGRFCQERLLKSRNFSTMLITPPLSIVIYLSFFISLFAFSRLFYNFRLTSKRTYSWSSSNYTIRCHLKKLTRNHTHSTLQSKSKNIENCIYILAKLDVKISRIDNTDQSCCF